MINIVYLSHCGTSIGGGEKQLYYLVKNLDRNKYNPLVICPEEGVFVELLKAADIPILILNLPSWRKVKSIFSRNAAADKLSAITLKHNTQLIHSSDSWLNPYLLQVKKKLNVPVISHVRNILTHKQVAKYAFDKIDGIIAISKESKSMLIQAGVPEEKIDVILNCVDISEFRPENKNNSNSQYVIGIVGRIEPFKNQKTFIEIAYQVNKQCPNIRFKIIGEALDIYEHRKYEKEIHHKVSKYKLENVISFEGNRSDMPEVFREIDLLVTLSAGSVIAEAMASGIPVIGTPIGSTSDMIVDGVTGFVVPINPIDVIVNRIVEISTNPNQNTQFGLNARKYAELNFSIKTHVEKIGDVYKKFL